MINVFGVLVSLFSVYVTINIYRKYNLNNSIFFIISSIAIFLWNILHLIFNFIPEDFENTQLIRSLWLLVVYSGMIFVFMFIFGFSSLRYENINWRLLPYSALGAAFSVLFATKPEWVNVGFTVNDGWVTVVHFRPFWSIFAVFILTIDFLELVIPLVNTYSRTIIDKDKLLIMLIAILFATFSNALEPILQETGQPQAIRFLVADFGFLIFFIILLRFPFTGLYDNSILNRVIIAGPDGTPQLTLPSFEEKSVLASGVIISINAILDEITNTTEQFGQTKYETIRKLELGNHQFYIITRGKIIVIYQFQNSTGVCYSKFKSLARIFEEEEQSEVISAMKILIFKDTIKTYFKDFSFENKDIGLYSS